MESLTNISALLADNSIVVPNYQRAYSWDTDKSEKTLKQVNTFLSDLQDYVNSKSESPYYFGHFLFEKREGNEYAIIDGQQRLTTTIIFISALYKRLLENRRTESIKDFDDDLFVTYCKTIKQGTQYRFSTVDYDNQMFRDYVIDRTSNAHNGIDTMSKARIVDAFDYFTETLEKMEEPMLLKLLRAITNASCTTHVVKETTEAVQMFIFQNNRGKRPTNLEGIKAQFMYHVHLYAPSEKKEGILSEITGRFEHIYRSISQIEGDLDEDNVLNYTIKVYRNNLGDTNSLSFVGEELGKIDSRITFISDFTRMLDSCFSTISDFLKLEKQNMVYHSLLVSAEKGLMYPFIIKAMLKGVKQDGLENLAKALEQIFLRDRIIGTRAVLLWRLNDCYQHMTEDTTIVVNHIEDMKTRQDWWGYWNNTELARCLNMGMNHGIAKILLWKYENYLREGGKAGYAFIRYDSVETPHLEHIAPQKENQEEDNGYCPYDEEFNVECLECLGNYLLLSGTHNISLGNARFQYKRKSYRYLQQQLEVQDMTEQDEMWDKKKIRIRHKRIVDFLTSIL